MTTPPRNKDRLVDNPSEVEIIKDKSNYLRGTLKQSLSNPITGALHSDDTQLSKFHGIYQQDDRELRQERQRRHLEPLWSFMVRVRIPAGILGSGQWLMIDQTAKAYGLDHFKLTTRQAVQFHGILKGRLRDVMQTLNRNHLDSIATCGDVNRNVMFSPVPYCGPAWEEILPWAKQLSDYFLPKSNAWHDIWINGKKQARENDANGEEEPLYGKHYLPRKFKTNFAVPPYNDTDIFANDLGFIAIIEDDKLQGFNVSVGGGLGMTHSVATTYPSVAKTIGFCPPENLLDVATAVLKVQRDYGNRHDRRLARLKYTIADMGLDNFKDRVRERMTRPLQEPRRVSFIDNNDLYGWFTDWKGRHYRTLYIEHGRVRNSGSNELKNALLNISAQDLCDFRLTGNQNLVLGKVSDEHRVKIDRLLDEHGVDDFEKQQTRLVKTSIACVALPTCPLAMAEAERYLPHLLAKVQKICDRHGIKRAINIRMTGCPNGCGRPYLAEIGLVGKSEYSYNVYLGGSQTGDRLNVLYQENQNEAGILEILDNLLRRYARSDLPDESFGDWVIRAGIVTPRGDYRDFHHSEPTSK